MDKIENLISEAVGYLERYGNRVSFPQIETPVCAFDWLDEWIGRVYDYLEAKYGSHTAEEFSNIKFDLPSDAQNFNTLIEKLEDCISWLRELK